MYNNKHNNSYKYRGRHGGTRACFDGYGFDSPLEGMNYYLLIISLCQQSKSGVEFRIETQHAMLRKIRRKGRNRVF